MLAIDPHTVTQHTDLSRLSEGEWQALEAFRAQERANFEYSLGNEGAARYWRTYAASWL